MVQLRDYQREAIDSIFNYFEKKKGNPLVTAPTGSGKSVIIASFCKEVCTRWPSTRIINLTHVKELVDQNARAIERFWPTVDLGVISAGLNRRELGHAISVAGIQSIYKKAEAIGSIDLVIIDEAHLLSPTQGSMYQKFIGDLKEINPHLKVIGFTATPYRTKGGCLTGQDNAIFTDICYEIGIDKLIKRGYLSEVISKWGVTQADMTGVKKTGGEFNIRDMASKFDSELTASAIDECLKFGQSRKKWMVFCANVDHCISVAGALNKAGVPSIAVHSKMTPAERDEAIAEFSGGRYSAIVNCGVLTTGFDEPQVDMLVLLRATQSASLYVQILGRGMRIHPDKENCLVLDFGGNIERFGPVDQIQIGKKGKRKDGIVVTPMKACENPDCRASNIIQARECIECGKPFTFKVKDPHEERAAGGALLSGQKAPPRWEDVTGVMFRRHTKRGNNTRVLKVTYMFGMLDKVDEYICLEHTGYARKKAIDWWDKMTGGAKRPVTVDEAIDRQKEIKLPVRVNVQKEGKYERVIGYEY